MDSQNLLSEAKNKEVKMIEKVHMKEEHKKMNLTDFILKNSEVLNLKQIPKMVENLRYIRKKKEEKEIKKTYVHFKSRTENKHSGNESGSFSKKKKRKAVKFDLKSNNQKNNEQTKTYNENYFKLMKNKALNLNSSLIDTQNISKKIKLTDHQMALKVSFNFD